jgi:hypothetical protein
MELLTDELVRRFAQVGRQQNRGYDALVLARYTVANTDWTWLATEYEARERRFFGYLGSSGELNYFTLAELEAVRGPSGAGVERDERFREKPLYRALRTDAVKALRVLEVGLSGAVRSRRR